MEPTAQPDAPLDILEQEPHRGKTGLEALTCILDDPYVLASYKIKAREGRLSPGELKIFMDYKYGKPPEKIEITGKDGGPVNLVRRIVVRKGEVE